jgi:hypothetical protein
LKDYYKFMTACSLISISIFSLGGCISAAMTVAGVGGSTAVTHAINGITFRTFTLPSKTVKNAAYVALYHMGIDVVGSPKSEKATLDIIQAKTAERDIEIQLEAISKQTTRMRVTAKSNGFFYDGATSSEIILQTEKVLASQQEKEN